jgi:molybdate transport system permease protein
MENGDRLRIRLEASPHLYQASARSFESWKILALPLLLFIAIPLVALFAHASIADLLTNLNQRQVIEAIRLSLVTSLASTLIALIFGTPVAYLLAQSHSRVYRLVDTLIDLPTVLPPSVSGVALLMAFGRQGLLGEWLAALGVEIPFTTLAVIMAQVFIASSLYVKAAAIGFSSIDPELKQAASLDGAGSWRTFREIDLPLSRMALLSGSVMTWARALGEFGATIIFAGNFPGRTQTMPLAIYMGFEIDLNVALTLSIILIGLSFLTLIIVKGILHRRIEAELEFTTRRSF